MNCHTQRISLLFGGSTELGTLDQLLFGPDVLMAYADSSATTCFMYRVLCMPYS